MLGNDLVDLEQAAKDSNWQRKGYLEKIYTEAEQQLISSAAHPSEMVWLLWSMKEAAYKVENRITGQRLYAPKNFRCTDLIITDTSEDIHKMENDHNFTSSFNKITNSKSITSLNSIASFNISAVVTYKNHIFHIRSAISGTLIHSLAFIDLGNFLNVHINYLENRTTYIQDFKELVPEYSLQKDKAGLPALIYHETGLKYAASISHHGKHLAIVYSGSLLLKD